MAKVEYIYPIANVNGGLGPKKRCICRTKHYKYENTTIAGSKEVYEVCHPRDYTKKPQLGKEKESSEAFSAARKKRIMIETQMPELYAQWKVAFLRQLDKPDKDSPLIPPENIKRKTYVRLANYIETKIRLRGGIELTAMGVD